MNNETIKNLLNHRSIRNFKNKQLTNDQVDTLIKSAQQGSSDLFTQQYSMIHVTDPKKLKDLADITTYQFMKDAPQYFLFIVDQHRNKEILKHIDKNVDTSSLGSADKFMGGVYDATIAAQNMLVAAEGMGLGGVYMGSISNNTAKVIDMFNLPQLTYPIFGLAIGYPNENPEVKPRITKDNITYENEYHRVNFDSLKKYDQIMSKYYKNRSSNQKNTTFSDHLMSIHKNSPIRTNMFPNMKKQGFFNSKFDQ